MPEFQNKGIGSRLVQEGLKRAQQVGYDFVVVLGEPLYYPRFGFTPASGYGLLNEYNVDDEFMALELTPGALANVSGTVQYQPEFEEAEG